MLSSWFWSHSLVWPQASLSQLLHESHRQLCRSRLRRSRGYHLYYDRHPAIARQCKAGQVSRLYDLYLDAGKALCGYRPDGTNTRLKNLMSRGLYAALPQAHGDARLKTLLQRLFPGVQEFRLYHSSQILEAELENFSLVELLCRRHSGGTALWRPLAAEMATAQRLIPVLPLSSLPLPWLFLSWTETELPPSDVCSPLQLEVLVQALGQVERLSRAGGLGDGRDWSEPALQDLRRTAVQSGSWEEDGIYLYWRGHSPEGYQAYAQLWHCGLEQGFLLPPNPWAPLILSPGLLQKTDNPRSARKLSAEGQRLYPLLDQS